MLVALEVCGSLYAFFLPTLHFWHFIYSDEAPEMNVSLYRPLYIMGATGGNSVGNSTVVRAQHLCVSVFLWYDYVCICGCPASDPSNQQHAAGIPCHCVDFQHGIHLLAGERPVWYIGVLP